MVTSEILSIMPSSLSKCCLCLKDIYTMSPSPFLNVTSPIMSQTFFALSPIWLIACFCPCVKPPPALAELPEPRLLTVVPPFVLKWFDFCNVPVKFIRAFAIPQNATRLQHFQRLSAVLGETFRFVWVGLCSVAGNAHDSVSRFTIKAPVIALLTAPAERRDYMDAVGLPVGSQPVLFVVHEKLHRKRHIAVQRKIRRTYRAELLQKGNVFVGLFQNRSNW